MPEKRFRRPRHQAIAKILTAFDRDFLLEAKCYFGGGTRIAMLCGEFRESQDIDFLCSDTDGYRLVRETVGIRSLGRLLAKELPLSREVRADRDAIRTFFESEPGAVKFELILEGRIDLSGRLDRRLGIPVLDDESLAAEKLLANADRGIDDSTFARDLIDLAFLALHVGKDPLVAGLARATRAYGSTAAKSLVKALERIERRGRFSECVRALGVAEPEKLKKGLSALRAIA